MRRWEHREGAGNKGVPTLSACHSEQNRQMGTPGTPNKVAMCVRACVCVQACAHMRARVRAWLILFLVFPVFPKGEKVNSGNGLRWEHPCSQALPSVPTSISGGLAC